MPYLSSLLHTNLLSSFLIFSLNLFSSLVSPYPTSFPSSQFHDTNPHSFLFHSSNSPSSLLVTPNSPLSLLNTSLLFPFLPLVIARTHTLSFSIPLIHHLPLLITLNLPLFFLNTLPPSSTPSSPISLLELTLPSSLQPSQTPHDGRS